MLRRQEVEKRHAERKQEEQQKGGLFAKAKTLFRWNSKPQALEALERSLQEERDAADARLREELSGLL